MTLVRLLKEFFSSLDCWIDVYAHVNILERMDAGSTGR